MVMHQEMRPAIGIPDDVLADPILRDQREAIYGREAIAREIILRQQERRQVVDLRGDDLPPPDPWNAAKQAARTRGVTFDPVTTAGMRCGLTDVGDAHDRETRRREQERSRENQCNRWVVALGASVTLRNGRALGAGQSIDEAQVEHPHAIEILQSLVERGVLSEIDGHLAWLRGLDASIGPYVVVKDFERCDGKKMRRGQGCKEEDFKPLDVPRRLTDDMRASDLSVKELRRLIGEEFDQRTPRAFPPRPLVSEFDGLRYSGHIEAAPNWSPSALGPLAQLARAAKRGGK
jgi:hypothetical protein